MKAEIIAIGDELLIGQTVNTNAAWMGAQLAASGISIEYCTVIRDERNAMLDAFDRAMSRVDFVLVTGGLGPTKDDITKDVICEFFGTELVENSDVLEHVIALFASRGREMQEVNKQQALVPAGCDVLSNIHGTAPGMWLECDGKILVSMPGVPYEMKYIMTTHVLPRLTERFELNALYFRTLHTQGIGESSLAERIEDIETEMRSKGVALAYLPSPGLVRLRLSGPQEERIIGLIDTYIELIKERLPRYVFGEGDTDLPHVIGDLLRERNLTLGTVESCTGGSLAAAIVTVPGASDYFLGSVVSYSNAVKQRVVGVSPLSLAHEGAVSQEVVEQMAVGGRQLLDLDYCIALSGVAGPDGGSEEKPVGTVWIALAGPNGVESKHFLFEKDRQRNIKRSVWTALNLLRCELLEINIEKS